MPKNNATPKQHPEDVGNTIWHIEKRIPIQVVLVIVLQIGSLVAGATALALQVQDLNKSVSVMSDKMDRQYELFMTREEATREFIRLETNIRDVKSELKEFDERIDNLERLSMRRPPSN